MPRAPDHRLPQPHPRDAFVHAPDPRWRSAARDAAIYYAFGLTPAELDRRLVPGADFPVPDNSRRRARLLDLVQRCRELAQPRRKS